MTYRGMSQRVHFESLPSPVERFALKELIGEGTYGDVYSAKDNLTGERVAVKILENVADNLEEIEEEYRVLRELSGHPNLPTFRGLYLLRAACREEDQLWFVMELCTGGSVTDLVQGLKQRGARLSDDQIAYILHETVEALVYLHANHCMHRDVKGHNILLTDDAQVKVVDFGVSSHLQATLGRRNTSVGTPYWMAPEVIACEQQLDSSYDCRCDVWSVGITAIELAEGEPPLSDLHPMRALFQIPRNPPPQLAQPEQHSAELVDFVRQCLVKDMEQRPFSRHLLRHPLLQRAAVQAQRVRLELRREMNGEGRSPRSRARARQRAPQVTTKHGQLKQDRKSKPQPMFRDDLAALDNLTEASIVEQLQRRFEQGQIYTYIGDILLAVNPFTSLGLYSEHEQARYRGRARSDNQPHIFAVADAAYQALVHQLHNQAIVISGESGAGKTVSANLLLKQLVFLGKAPNRNLEKRILQVNPVMEAFGNAQTGINSNSSRFGKYLDVAMTRSGRVTGARISVYLLEQSRVVQQAEGERNFHVFYYLYDGLEREGRLHEFHLDADLRVHHAFLAGERTDPTTKQANVERFYQLKAAFGLLGFRADEVDSVYRVLAAILHIGDLEFADQLPANNGAGDPGTRLLDVAPLHRVSQLLGVDAAELVTALTSTSVVTRGETITRCNSRQEASAARHALAKGLYGRLFDWMVNQINTLLAFTKPGEEPLSIGLLDIFGFENFPRNSFEQLCINIANEQIQYYFNQHIFTWEQQEYMAEGVPVDLVEFSDNRPVLDMLLSRPLGLLALLDEESRFPRASDRTLVDKFHCNMKSRFYVRPKGNALCFAVCHYAGRVAYQADGFLEKNRNFLPPEVIQVVRRSSIPAVRFLFQCPITRTGNLYAAATPSPEPSTPPERFSSVGLASQSRAQQTVSTYFRFSLMDLLQKMVSGTPQFVRCIKPSEERPQQHQQRGAVFDAEKVLRQLRYTGVLETIRIRQHGFSHRLPFAEFLKRYYFLGFGFKDNVPTTRESCRLLLVRLHLDGWALGKTKVFLKYYHVEYLAKLYEEQVRQVVLVQAVVRGWLARLRYRRALAQRDALRQSALTLQRYVRGWIERRRSHEAHQLAQQAQQAQQAAMHRRQHRQRQPASANPPKKSKQASAAAWLKARLRRRGNDNKENQPLDPNQAAVLIQSHFRGYTVRRRWRHNLELEARQRDRAGPVGAPMVLPLVAVPMATPESRTNAELAAFSQKVHASNQEAHRYLRRHKHAAVGKASSSAAYYEALQDHGVRLNAARTEHAAHAAHVQPEAPRRLRARQGQGQRKQSSGSVAPAAPSATPPDVHRVLRDATPTLSSTPASAAPSPARTPAHTPVPLAANKGGNSPSGSNEDLRGPYDFRRLLRPTDYLPTESLRKRKGVRVTGLANPSGPGGLFGPGRRSPPSPTDSPVKRRPMPGPAAAH
ncbi:myosin-IIIb-like [Thrips palmi]|uniref:non-specific serine/threonine protein kinase n=1 Tax=Thrips palmi TaxID=161013 RepID=A0A6P8Z2U6_THRPL|nr:myosin-IIIb-like [Thrips palmi]